MHKPLIPFAYLLMLLCTGCEPTPIVVFDTPPSGRGYNMQHILGDSLKCTFLESAQDTHNLSVLFDRNERNTIMILDQKDTLLCGKVIRRNGLYYCSDSKDRQTRIFAFSIDEDTIRGLSKEGPEASAWIQCRYLYMRHKETNLNEYLVDETVGGAYFTVHAGRRLLRKWFREVPDSCHIEPIALLPDAPDETVATPDSEIVEKTISATEWYDKGVIRPEIFPNPASDRVTITHPRSCRKIEILNHLGRVVLSSHAEGTQTVCNLNNLPSGHFLVRLWNEDSLMATVKLVCVH